MKIAAVGMLGLLVGGIGGFALGAYAQWDAGDRAAWDYLATFGTLAEQDGTPKTPQKALRDARNVLALDTVGVGLVFADMNDQMRREVVRTIRLIESDPELQPAQLDQNAKWAADARRCVLEKAEQPEVVVACVRSAQHAMKVQEPTATTATIP